MNWLTKIIAGAALLFMTACATVPEITSGSTCVRTTNGNQSYEVTFAAINPRGASTPTQTLSWAVPTDGDCATTLLDGEDKPIHFSGLQSAGKDVRASAIEAFSTAPTAMVSGMGSAAMNSCKGGNCGGNPVFVQANALANAGAQVEMCGGAPCASVPHGD